MGSNLDHWEAHRVMVPVTFPTQYLPGTPDVEVPLWSPTLTALTCPSFTAVSMVTDPISTISVVAVVTANSREKTAARKNKHVDSDVFEPSVSCVARLVCGNIPPTLQPNVWRQHLTISVWV